MEEKKGTNTDFSKTSERGLWRTSIGHKSTEKSRKFIKLIISEIRNERNGLNGNFVNHSSI